MRVFVTGGSSPLGELVIPRLAITHEVAGLARSATAASRVQRAGARAVPGSLDDPGAWASEVRAADAIVHLAGLMSTETVAQIMDPAQPLTTISSASVRVPGHPLCGRLEQAERRLARLKPRALVLLRPTMMYGSPRDRTVRSLVRVVRRLPAVPRLMGGGLIQPVLADDVADAVATTLADADGLVTDLGGPVPMRIGELIAAIALRVCRPVIAIPVPVPALAWAATLASRRHSSAVLHALAMLQHDRSVSAAPQSVIGHPATPLHDGLRTALARYPREYVA